MEIFVRGASSWYHSIHASMLGRAEVPRWTRLTYPPRWVASQLYGVLAASHRASYTWGLRTAHRLPCRVVSIGNLTVGGTGKTPVTLWLARWFQQQGWRVAIVSRGYKARCDHTVVSTGTGPLVAWQEVGDEPYLLAQALPGVPVLISKARALGGYEAWERFGAEVVLLDDGFQHHALSRDLDLVLVDASQPFGRGSLLPAGVLREPLAALRRADAVLLTRVDMAAEAVPALCQHLRTWLPEQPIYLATMENTGLYNHHTTSLMKPHWLQGRRVVAFAGIGNPRAFTHTITRSGGLVLACFLFPDHYPYTLADWQEILQKAQQYQADAVVTTEKDAVRIAPQWRAALPLVTLQLGIRFLPAQPSFGAFLHARLTRPQP